MARRRRLVVSVRPASGRMLVRQIASQLEHAITRRDLLPGDELPTVRELSIQLRVSSNVIARAYAQLERAGLVEIRHQGGVFVRARPLEEVYR